MAIYKEDDWIAEVKVLENNSTNDWERYKLEVVNTIQESKIYKPTPNGYVFNVEQTKMCCIWSLENKKGKKDWDNAKKISVKEEEI